MLFNSWTFLLFFAVVLALYYSLPHRGQNQMLLVASYIFYGWWDWRFAGLLLLSELTTALAEAYLRSTEDAPSTGGRAVRAGSK